MDMAMRKVTHLIFILSVFCGAIFSSHTAAMSFQDGVPGMEILRSDAGGLLLELTVPNYAVQQVMVEGRTLDRLDVPGYSPLTEPGTPQLPVRSLLLGVPADADIQVRILEDDAVVLDGSFDLAAAPWPAPLESDLGTASYQYLPGFDSMYAGEYYPDVPVYVESEAWIRDQRVARLEFSPFQYHPNSGAVIWHRRVLVEVNFLGDSSGLSDLPAQPGATQDGLFEQVLQGMLLNYAAARSWRTPPDVPEPRVTSVEGERIEIQVNNDGIYKVTYDDLQASGWPVSEINPQDLSLSSQGETG